MARTKTADTDTGEATNGKGPGRKPGTQNVPVTFHGLQPVSKLPERAVTNRNPEFHDAMTQIRDQGLSGQAFELQTYGDDERANGSARNKASALRKQYTEADGWTIRVGPSEVEPGRVGLFVQYG